MWLLMISLMLRFQWMNSHWRPPPGFVPSPVDRALSAWQGTAFSPLRMGWDGLSPVWRSTPEPVTVVDSSQGNQIPAKEIPRVDVGCSLSKTHTCRERHSRRECKRPDDLQMKGAIGHHCDIPRVLQPTVSGAKEDRRSSPSYQPFHSEPPQRPQLTGSGVDLQLPWNGPWSQC